MSLVAELTDWYVGQKLLLCNSKGLPMRETEVTQLHINRQFRTQELSGAVFRECKPGIAMSGPFLVMPAESPGGLAGIRKIRASKAIQRISVSFSGTRAPDLRSLRLLEALADRLETK